MAELIALSPLAGLLPAEIGAHRLVAGPAGPISSLAPFPGRRAAVDGALAPLGLRFPDPGEVIAGTGGARIFWTGRETAFLAGAAAPEALAGAAAVTDQSDGWAAMTLEGPATEAVLARLVPVDCGIAAFPPGRCLRAPLQHLPAIFLREAPGAVAILVFRSMAQSAVHELSAAMRAVEARAGAGRG